MIRSAIPNEDDFARIARETALQVLQKLHRGLGVTGAIFPEKAVTIGEVIGTKPVDAVGEAWRSTGDPVCFANGGPGVADFHVLVQMDFIEIDKDNILLTDLFIKPLKLCNKGFPFLGIRFGQQLLALFPTESSVLQDCTQRVMTDLAIQFAGNPVA